MASVISVDPIDRTTETHQSSNNLEKEIGFCVGMETMVQTLCLYYMITRYLGHAIKRNLVGSVVN
jgi:hypothetical protein